MGGAEVTATLLLLGVAVVVSATVVVVWFVVSAVIFACCPRTPQYVRVSRLFSINPPDDDEDKRNKIENIN